MVICRVGVGEMAPELSPGTEGWERLIHDLAQIQPDLLVLNELPVGMQIVGPSLETGHRSILPVIWRMWLAASKLRRIMWGDALIGLARLALQLSCQPQPVQPTASPSTSAKPPSIFLYKRH